MKNVVDLGDGVAVLTAKVTNDFTCNGKPGASPSFAGAVFVKDGDNWKAAYHQTGPAPDSKGDNPTPPADAPKPEGPTDGDKELTAKLVEKEKELWEAWAKKDPKPFEAMLAENFTGFNLEGPEDRAAAIKSAGDHKCDVKGSTLSDAVTSKINDKIYLLTYKASVDGKCDGNPIPNGFWAATVLSKDGDALKAHFHMVTPAM